jgi:hypothetical protein
MEHPEIPFPENGNAHDTEMQKFLRENCRLMEYDEILKTAVGNFKNAQS